MKISLYLSLISIISWNLTACSLLGTSSPPEVPTYPNAQASRGHDQAFSFTTPDSPTMILGFYKQALRQRGWALLAEDTRYLDFGYATAEYDGFHLAIDVAEDGVGQTAVTIVQRPVHGTD